MKAIMQTLKMMLIAAIVCCGATSAIAQNNFTITGKVILGGSGGVGVPNWTVNAKEITTSTPVSTFTTTTDLNGNYQIVVPNGANIGSNRRWEVSTYDSCSLVLRKDTVQNAQGSVISAVVNFELTPCQNNMCGIGWQYTVQNNTATFFSSAFGATNGHTRYFWNFGDGNTSTNKNPVHTYAPGRYKACAWVFSKAANSNDYCIKFFCDSVFINSTTTTCNALMPDFSFTASGHVVSFNNLTQSAHPNDMLYTWKFGDGNTSNDKNPVHTYSSANVYNVCLIAKDLVNNCLDSICKQVTTTSAPPICNANFGILSSSPNTLTLVAPATVTFKDSSTSATPGTGVNSWQWKVNGNTVSTLQNPTYTFSQPGTYTVCLIITTSNGCTDDFCKQITVLPATTCAVTFNATQAANSYQVNFQSTTTSNNTATQPISYQWTFGDGSGSSVANPTHTYTAPGTYYVCVNVAFSNGCTAQKCDSVQVNNLNNNTCNAYFGHNNNGLNISTYAFLDSSTTNTPNNPITAWEWQVDNMIKSTQQNFTYTFTSSGTYVVCLKITTLNGCTDTYCKTITVGNNIQCNANFTASPVTGFPNKIEFTNTSTSPTIAGTFYSWNFGDGSPIVQSMNAQHTYAQPGVYTVCLYLFNQNIQCYDTICKPVTVGNPNTNCTASFIYTVNGNTVTFNNTSTPGLNTNSYFWTFGDGTTATGINPTHTYNTPGTYQVCLTVIGTNSNCTNSVCHTIVIGQNTSLHCISGKVFKGTPNSAAFPARVVLIYHDDVQGTLTAVQFTTTGANGGYEFCNVPNGKYLVKAFLTPNDPQYNSFLPTYYGNSLFWNYATSVMVTQNVQQIDIWLIAGNNPGGPGFVGGYVSQGANKMQAPGDALQDVQVMLLDMFDNPVQYIFSNEEGRWTFDNVAFGTYQVYAEIPGKETIPYIVTISEQQPNIDNIVLLVETEQIISSINEIDNIFNAGVSVFPNPVSDKLFIETNLKHQAEISISITDITGKTVMYEKANIPTGVYKYALNIAAEKQGLYILKIEYKGFSNIYKVLKF